nr:tripartite tricarboxylate transporter substrate binding protein [Variovorax boronicumulans]
MHAISRRALTALALALPFTAALANDYPNKPVRVIIPFPPGGTLDTVGRLLAQKLSEQTGQNFIIDNRPGGNATIGSNNVAKSPADGYTLLFNASTFTTSTHFLKTPPYDPLTDFTPIALVAKAPLSVSVNKDLPITDVKSLITYAKANPGKLSFAVGSIASAGHFSTELIKSSAGLNLQIVPYKGSAPAYQDLVGGQIAGFVDPVLGATSFYKSGMLKIIAVTSKTRLPTLPEVPTVGETIPGYEFYSWYGLWGPAKLPADVTAKLNAEVNKALAGDMKERLTSQGILLGGGSPEEFARFQKDDTARAFKTIADANIRPE